MTEYLAGRLLLSAPSLKDPNFARVVLYLCRHDEEGAFGLVLNRPLATAVEDALPAMMGLSFAAGFLMSGGPVQPDNIFIIHDDQTAGGESSAPGIMHGGDTELLERLAAKADLERPPRVRFYAGYSGWSAGQLEMELEQHSWIVATAEVNRVLEARGPEDWAEILREMGGRFALMADAPLDPDWN